MDRIKIELNATTMQRPSVRCPVGRLIDPWLAPSARVSPRVLHCVSIIEAVAEKLIAFPRRLAHWSRQQEQGLSRKWDHTLVRHLYDVTRLQRQFPALRQSQAQALLQTLMRNLVIKDAFEFRTQHEQFVEAPHAELRWAMQQARSPAIRAEYETFLVNMVYAPPARQPTFDEAVKTFEGLLTRALEGPSSDTSSRDH